MKTFTKFQSLTFVCLNEGKKKKYAVLCKNFKRHTKKSCNFLSIKPNVFFSHLMFKKKYQKMFILDKKQNIYLFIFCFKNHPDCVFMQKFD